MKYCFPDKCLITCLFLVIVVCGKAQDAIKKVIPPSPTVAALGEYGNTPVGYYTGTPNISIPIHTITCGDLSLPVSLSYAGKGIRVEEMASWVGLGWSLNAGGVITRTVRGGPDEYGNGYMSSTGNVSDMVALWPGTTWLDMSDPLYNFPIPFKEKMQEITRGTIDAEPDLFYFNFGAHSGKFYYNQNDENFVSIPQQAIYFDKDYFVTNNTWHLIMEDGTEYFFDLTEQNLNYTDCNGNASTPQLITTGWFLTKIYSPSTGRQIDLDYTAVSYSIENLASYTLNTSWSGSLAGCVPDTKKCNSMSTYSGYRLDSIVYDGGKLKFKANTDRCDLPGDKRLDIIELYNMAETTPWRKFEFGYTYFNNSLLPPTGCGTDLDTKVRLKLASLKTVNASGLYVPPHTFEYKESISVPEIPDRMSYAQDAWGYFNNETTNTHLVPPFIFDLYSFPIVHQGANRTVDTLYTDLGTLAKINYPTGGSTTFEYENNKAVNYIRFSTNKYLKNRMEILDMSSDCNGSDPAPVFCKTITINDTRSTGAYVTFRVANMTCWNCASVPPPAPTSCAIMSLGGMQIVCNSDYVFVPNGTYSLSADFTGASNASQYESFSIQLFWEEYDAPAGPHEANIGGLRIKKIVDNDGQNDVRTKKYEYTGGYLSEHRAQYEYQMRCAAGTTSEILFIVRSSFAGVPLGTTQGSPIGYAVVTEKREDHTNGKTVYHFSHAGTFPDAVNYSFPYGDPVNIDYRRGLLVKQEDFKWNGSGYVLLQSTENDYKPLDTSYDWEDLSYVSTDPLYNETLGIKAAYVDIIDPQIEPVPWAVIYKTVSEWIRQIKTTKRQYDDAGNFVETVTYNDFNNPNHLQPTQTRVTQSDEGETITRFKYPLDYTPGSSTAHGIKVMRDKHFINPVIEKIVIEKNSSGTEQVVGGIIQTYDQKSLPQRVYVYQNAVPELNSAFTYSTFTGGSFVMDDNFSKVIEFTKFDIANGNLLEQQKDLDIVTSYLWGYNSVLPVAEVKNAYHENIYHTSFEEDGVTFLDGNSKNIARTGRKVWNSGSFSIPSFSPPQPGDLVMSYWYWDNTNSIWRFSGEIAYNSAITSAGTKLDEIRVYPKGAQMTTYTYDAGIGMTSATDVNNRVSYYEYDSFGRLKYIRDDKGSLVNQYQYHYKNQSGNP